MRRKQPDARQKFAGNCADSQAEEIPELRGGNQNCDAVGEADDHHARDEADSRAQAGEAHQQEQNAGHQRHHSQAAHAKAEDDAGDDHHEGAGGTANLRARTAQRGDQKASHNGGIKSCLRRDSGGDAEGHGQRQCDEAHRDSSQQIVKKYLERVIS